MCMHLPVFWEMETKEEAIDFDDSSGNSSFMFLISLCFPHGSASYDDQICVFNL